MSLISIRKFQECSMMNRQTEKGLCLVTGGAGFVGSHTVDALVARGYSVRILDNLHPRIHPKGKPSYLPPSAEFLQGDVSKRYDLGSALQDVAYVFHFAAYQDYLPDFSTFVHVNAESTALLYELIVANSLPVKKIVVASSQAVYGEGRYHCQKDGSVYPNLRGSKQLESGQWEPSCPRCGADVRWQTTDESVPNPQNAYALSKLSQEMIALQLGRRYQIPTLALRYSIVQGPRQSFYNAYSGACRVFCLSAYFNQGPLVYEDGQQIRDYVNIHDAVSASLLVMEKPEADYQVFNVGGGKGYTVLELAEIVARVFGKDLQPRVPGVYRFGDTRHIVSDIMKLKTLGWSPTRTPEDSIRDYHAWLHEQENVQNILEYQERQMKELNVLRSVRR